MRRLYFVPVLHAPPDMGSAAAALQISGAASLGKRVWERHQQVVAAFWVSIRRYFEGIEVAGLKVFQDGLVADGAEARRIVAEGVKAGSTNYAILAGLTERGSVLLQTEALSLVKQEHNFILRIAGARSPRDAQSAVRDYRLAQPGLLQERDSYIAGRVAQSLGAEDCGALFIGAQHDVLSRIPNDIQVRQVKERGCLCEYHELLTRPTRDPARLRELADYLMAPVNVSGW